MVILENPGFAHFGGTQCAVRNRHLTFGTSVAGVAIRMAPQARQAAPTTMPGAALRCPAF